MANLSLFSQIISKLPRQIFQSLVANHKSDYRDKGVDSWTHLISMLFCHFAKSTSVRDISNGLLRATNLKHLGLKRAPSKSSLSYQNKHRDADLFNLFLIRLKIPPEKQESKDSETVAR